MSLFTKLANAIFSPVDAAGHQRSVLNGDAQVWGSEVERILAAFQAGGGIVFPDLATANASLAYAPNQMAWVMGDPTPANNGVYRKIGASGTGSWARMGDLPFSMIPLSNAGAGTPDAIIAEPMLPMPTTPGAALLTVNILAANTGNVTLNGKPLRTNSGNEIAPGGLTAGSIHAFLDLGDHFRLLSDQTGAAIVAAAEQAVLDAQAARDQAEAIVGFDGTAATVGFDGVASGMAATDVQEAIDELVANSGNGVMVASRAWAIANYHPPAEPDALRTAGYASAGDGGGALYASNGTSSGDLVITLDDGVTEAGYDIAEAVVRPEMFGATVNAGSSQHAAMQAMMDANIVDVYLPSGVWRCDTTITRTTDIHLHGPGTLDFSGGNAQMLIEGTLTQIDALSANIAKHGQTLQWADDQGLAARDIILGYNPTDYSWGSRRAEYRDGFMFRVHSMSGNNARVYGLAVDAYDAADFDIYKVTAPRAVVEGVTFIGNSSSSLAPLKLLRCQDSRISGVRAWGSGGSEIQVDQCFGVDIDCSSPANRSAFVNDEYGISIANSHNVNVRGGNPVATRHAVAVGGFGVLGSIPNRYINISGMTLLNNRIEGGAVAAADIHGNTDFITYDNCVMQGGGLGGRNVSYRNCTVFGWVGDDAGHAFYGAEIVGGIFSIEDCTIFSEGNGAAFGYINAIPLGPGNGTNRPVETHMREDLHLIVRNVTLVTPNAGSTAKAVAIRAQNADKKINVTIDGLNWIAPQGLAFFTADDSELAALPSDGFVVDNVQGPAGARLIYPTTHIAAVPTREMEQRGSFTYTTTSSTVNAPPAITFRYPYSRMPSGTAAVSSGTGADSGQTAGQNAIPKIYAISATEMRLAMLASSAFTAGVSVRFHWSAGVFDL